MQLNLCQQKTGLYSGFNSLDQSDRVPMDIDVALETRQRVVLARLLVWELEHMGGGEDNQ